MAGVGGVEASTRTQQAASGTRPSGATGPRESAAEVAPSGNGIPIPADASQGQLQLFALALTGALDPTTMLQAIEMQSRNQKTDAQRTAVGNADAESSAAESEKMRLLRKAEKALKKAQKRMPSWARKLISAVVTAIGSVLSIFGGAGAALIAVGIVLIAAGDIVSGMAERGMIGEKGGMIAALVLKVAGAVVMFVAGVTAADTAGQAAQAGAEGGKAAADTAQTTQAAAETAQTAQKVAEATKWLKLIKSLIGPLNTITQATFDVVNGAFGFKAEQRRLDAEEQQLTVDDANDDRDEAVEVLKNAFERYQRIANRFAEARQINNEAQLFAAQAIA